MTTVMPAGAASLAAAVTEGDETALDALVDYVNENRRHPPYDIGGYCDRLEDALREIKRTVLRGGRLTEEAHGVDGRLLSMADVDRIYALCFALEREAKLYKRSGPA